MERAISGKERRQGASFRGREAKKGALNKLRLGNRIREMTKSEGLYYSENKDCPFTTFVAVLSEETLFAREDLLVFEKDSHICVVILSPNNFLVLVVV